MAGFFDTLFGGGAEKEAADRNRAAIAQYGQQSLGALKDAYGQSTGYGQSAVSAYDPLAGLGQKYNRAGDVWMSALGVTDPSVAAGKFQTTPGYQLTQNAALDAIDRRRAIGGMYASGNADQDTANWITKNLYETQYQPWMQGLQTAAGMGGQYTGAAAAGQAGGYTNLANLAQQYGQSQTGVYGNELSGQMDANKLEAAGAAAGAKNLLGAGLSLLSLPMGGGMSLGGGLISGAGGLIGQALAPAGGFTGFTSMGR